MINIRKILLPMDCKQECRFALEYAVNFARKYQAKLYVLSVVHEYNVIETLAALFYRFSKVFHAGEELELPKLHIQEDACNDIKFRLESMLRHHIPPEIEYEVLIRVGDEAEKIVKFAEEADVDLIILFTHGRSGLSRALMGNVTEKVLLDAPCPVLSIKHPERDFVD